MGDSGINPGGAGGAGRRSSRRKSMMCGLCKRNGEPFEIWSGHPLKDKYGRVVCPVLFAYKCRFCGATGHQAHTDTHCPKNPNTFSITKTPGHFMSNGKPRY